MNAPLALTGEGFHFARVKTLLTLLVLASLALAAPATAQDALGQPPTLDNPNVDDLPPPAMPEDLLPDDGEEGDDAAAPPIPEIEVEAPDYSRLSSDQERAVRLDDMFARLRKADSSGNAALIAEEIWAVWTRSGSPSVDFVLRRAASAQASGRNARARALFDKVTTLQPDYAEGWYRSGRLALDEADYSRAVGDSIRALQIEPRHYLALWTVASVLERLGKSEEALEAYREANRLYPELEGVKSRVEALEAELDGGVL